MGLMTNKQWLPQSKTNEGSELMQRNRDGMQAFGISDRQHFCMLAFDCGLLSCGCGGSITATCDKAAMPNMMIAYLPLCQQP